MKIVELHYWKHPTANERCVSILLFRKWAINIKNTKPLFSERNGYVKYRSIGFGYRVNFRKAILK